MIVRDDLYEALLRKAAEHRILFVFDGGNGRRGLDRDIVEERPEYRNRRRAGLQENRRRKLRTGYRSGQFVATNGAETRPISLPPQTSEGAMRVDDLH